MFGVVSALGNDVNRDGRRDLIVHAGIPDAAGGLAHTRGSVFSGADGSFLYQFNTVPGGSGPGPADPPEKGDPDQIGVVLSNFGMEGATLQQGDLNLDTRVGAPDLIIAIENTFGAAAATQSPDPDAGVDCTGVIPLVDETGEPVDPCEGDGGGATTPGGGDPRDPDQPASFFDDCEAKWANPNNPPDNSFDCIMMALCLAHNEAGGLRQRWIAVRVMLGLLMASPAIRAIV